MEFSLPLMSFLVDDISKTKAILKELRCSKMRGRGRREIFECRGSKGELRMDQFHERGQSNDEIYLP